MKKKYTRKQITEAIAYWKKQLKAGNYKQVNESSLRKSYSCDVVFYYADDADYDYNISINEKDKNLHFTNNKKTIKESLYAFKLCIEDFFKKNKFAVNVIEIKNTIALDPGEWECSLNFAPNQNYRAIRDLIIKCGWKIPYTVDNYDMGGSIIKTESIN